MRKTTIYLDDLTDNRLIEISRQRGCSRAALIRDAVERMIVDHDRPSRPPRALGASGHANTSEQVDEILVEGFGE